MFVPDDSESDFDFDVAPAPVARGLPLPPEVIGQGADEEIRRPSRPRPAPDPSERPQPYSEEAEQHVLSCCILDGQETMARCESEHLTPESFYIPANRLIYRTLRTMWANSQPIDVTTLIEELDKSGTITAVGGLPYLMQVSGRIPTTAHAGYFIERVRELATKREVIRQANTLLEHAYNGVPAADLLQEAEESLRSLSPPRAPQRLRSLFDFPLPLDDDKSILLGNRYLNRGDALVLSSTSGMGKSSMSLQMAVLWALGHPFAGIKPNGPMRSLIIQSEDSDGDIAEIITSLCHSLSLTERQKDEVRERVRIVTDRVSRGPRFIANLRRQVDSFNPDLVFINPLQAFMDGDVTQSQDLGAFLREGLNSLNEPPRFGYVVIHHTVKPATGKDKSERLWHEVMYDMAGGAEIINWARAIMSLRPTETEGHFVLNLAKRGKRAGVMEKEQFNAAFRWVPTTKIPLKHATGTISIQGRSSPMPVIFWEPRDPDPEEESSSKPGRKPRFTIDDIADFMPKPSDAPVSFNQLHKLVGNAAGIPRNTLRDLLERERQAGRVYREASPTLGPCFRLAY